MARAIRRLRHWRQRFEPNAAFIWRRPGQMWSAWRPPSVVEGRATIAPGELLPPELAENPRKVRTLWEAERIELADFDEPPRYGVAGVITDTADSGGPAPKQVSPESAQSPAAVPARDDAAGDEPPGTTDTEPGAGDDDPPTDTEPSDAEPPLVSPDLLPAGATVERRGVAWFIVTLADGTEHKVNGKAKLEALLADLRGS